jgi:hypothetical protein
MQTVQEFMVNEHINDLRREAESMRTERRMRHRTRDWAGGGQSMQGRRPPARVRLGHLLIGIGIAVSGSTGDPHGA